VGASIAYHLARRARQPRRAHVKIILVDSGQDHRASNMTWGYANSFWKKPLNYHDLNQLSVQAWPAFLNLLGCSDAGKHGALMFAVDEPAACALKDRLSAAQSLGHSVQEISEKEAGQIVGPGVKLRQSKLTAYCEDELIVNAEYVARCACAKLHELNAVHVHSRVEKLRVNSGQVVGVVLSDGRCLEADVVVISAGCGSQELAASAGISLPVECTHDAPSYGQSILPNHGLDIPFLLRVSTSGKGQLVFDQLITRNDGRVMLDSGASGRNTTATERMDTWKEYVPQVSDWSVESKTTSKPVPKDGYPIVGFVDPGRRIYVCVTHSGVTLAPLLGKYAALEVIDGVDVEALQPYRLSRFK